ncbi:hypothetical protein ASF78_08165 [Cellulomonas sp. Leaf334]|nr:hypothetical protein ASF78_08165 [Cellulomonas sp. Leaf334]
MADEPSLVTTAERFGDCSDAAREAFSAVLGHPVPVDLYISGDVLIGEPPAAGGGREGRPRDESAAKDGPRFGSFTSAPRQASYDDVFDQSEIWVDVAGQAHIVREMTTAHLANVLLYLDTTAPDRLTWWYVAHELAEDPLPISLLELARAPRPEAVELIRSLFIYEAVENEIAHRLGAPRTEQEPVAWLGARFASHAEARQAWSQRHRASAGATASLFDVAWHVRGPRPTAPSP